MEGKRSWWIGRASNPVGGAMRRRVGSTPIPLRHGHALACCAARSRACVARRTGVRLRYSTRPRAARDGRSARRMGRRRRAFGHERARVRLSRPTALPGRASGVGAAATATARPRSGITALGMRAGRRDLHVPAEAGGRGGRTGAFGGGGGAGEVDRVGEVAGGRQGGRGQSAARGSSPNWCTSTPTAAAGWRGCSSPISTPTAPRCCMARRSRRRWSISRGWTGIDMTQRLRRPTPADGIAILLWAADPDAPQRLATPFFHAAAAAAMDMPVEIYFTARSVQLLVPGVADGAARLGAHPQDHARRDARGGRARRACFYACTDALHAHGLAGTHADRRMPRPRRRGAVHGARGEPALAHAGVLRSTPMHDAALAALLLAPLARHQEPDRAGARRRPARHDGRGRAARAGPCRLVPFRFKLVRGASRAAAGGAVRAGRARAGKDERRPRSTPNARCARRSRWRCSRASTSATRRCRRTSSGSRSAARSPTS